jgi:hypothetical protein
MQEKRVVAKRLAMDPEKRIATALENFRRWLDRAKEKHQLLHGEVDLRENGDISVTLGDKSVFLLPRHELLAPVDDEAFKKMLKSTWDRELARWEAYQRKDIPRGRHGPAKGDRTDTRSSGR